MAGVQVVHTYCLCVKGGGGGGVMECVVAGRKARDVREGESREAVIHIS